MTALEKSDRYNPDCSVLAWLKTIAFNHVREQRRKSKRLVPVCEINGVQRRNDTGRSEVDLFEALRKVHYHPPESQPRLCDLLGRVPQSYHQILEISIDDGLEPHDIAAKVDMGWDIRLRLHLTLMF